MTQTDTQNRIMVSVTGVTEAGMQQELLAVVREFCKKSGVWTDVLTQSTNTATTSYTLTPGAGREITQIDQLYINDYPFQPVTDHGHPVGISGAYYSYDREAGQVHLAEYPDAGTLSVYVWLRPVALANVPAFVWADWQDALVAGATAGLLLQPSKPYTNPAMAAIAHRRFQAAIAQVRRRMLSSNSRADIGWTFPLDTVSRSIR